MAYTKEEAARLVLAAGIQLLDRGLIARTWGNISARLSESEFLITPSGRAYETLTPEELVAVKIADCSWEGDVKPSSEKGVHAALYALRPEVDFITPHPPGRGLGHRHRRRRPSRSPASPGKTSLPCSARPSRPRATR